MYSSRRASSCNKEYFSHNIANPSKRRLSVSNLNSFFASSIFFVDVPLANKLIAILDWSELSTSISNTIIDFNYLVYPNPFTDYTTLKLSDAVQTRKIDVIDIHGRIVRTIDNINNNSVTIHRENLTSGIYFIRIQSDDTYVKKVIIR